MPIFAVEGTQEAGFVPALVPDFAAVLSAGTLISREEVEAELDTCLRELRDCWQREPDQVLLAVSAISARLTELWVHLHRAESKQRQFKQMRTMQVTPMLTECDRQSRLHSRIIEIRRQDIELNR